MYVGSSSPTRDRTWAPCIGSAGSYPLDHQGSPTTLIFEESKQLSCRCPTACVWFFSHYLTQVKHFWQECCPSHCIPWRGIVCPLLGSLSLITCSRRKPPDFSNVKRSFPFVINHHWKDTLDCVSILPSLPPTKCLNHVFWQPLMILAWINHYLGGCKILIA